MTTLVVATPEVAGQNPLPEEDQDEQFMEFTSDVAHTFVELFLFKEYEKTGTIMDRSPETWGNKKPPIVAGSEEAILTEAQTEIAYQVAQRLKDLGDQIDEQLKAEVTDALTILYQKQSIWDFGYNHFQGLLHGVLGKCSGVINTGWEQVSVIYTIVAKLVGELRVNQKERGGLREKQMEGFAGTYMRDSGLQEWIQQQGGMTQVSQAPVLGRPVKVNISETEV